MFRDRIDPMFTAVSTLLMVGCVGTSSVSEEEVRRLIASQATSEMAVFSDTPLPAYQPSDVRLDPGPSLSVGSVWRGMIAVDHWHPYLVALIDDQLLTLGGFSEPQIRQAADALRTDNLDPNSTRELVETLAALADPHGALGLEFTRDTNRSAESSAQLRTWQEIAPANWPEDSVRRLDLGTWTAQVTVLSRDVNSYVQTWTAFAYSFEFDERGGLVSWHRRASEPFVAG